jgi:hypothetical protein
MLHRWGNRILTERNTETKCGAETEKKAIQRLPHLGIHCIYITRHYCGCWKVLVDKSLIWLSPVRFCQSLTNTEVDAVSQPLD